MLWVWLILILYPWLGYPLTLMVMARFAGKPGSPRPFEPFITVLVTVHNEQDKIAQRLANLQALDYPADKLEIMVASDRSSDSTDELVREAAQGDGRVRLLSLRSTGKSCAQNQAIPEARGEVIVLTDAGTSFQADTVRQLAAPLASQEVGCVSGRLLLADQEGAMAQDQGLYWRFETLLRRLESALGLLHTATGAVMAFRKDLFKPYENRYGDDCIIPLLILEQGKRIVHNDAAIASDTFPATPAKELRARVRMTLRNLTCTLSRPALLNPAAHPLLSWAIICHKLCRWLTPYFFLALLVTALVNVSQGWIRPLVLAGQAAFCLASLVGWFASARNIRLPLFSAAFSFATANVGFFLGVLKAATGGRIGQYKN